MTTNKEIYRIIECKEGFNITYYNIEKWIPPTRKWFIFKVPGEWKREFKCYDSEADAKYVIARRIKYGDGPTVVWQSNIDEEIESAVFNDN